MSTEIDTEVRALLEARRGDWAAMTAEGSGCPVSYSWISKFVCGHIENPGLKTLKDLRGFLIGEAIVRSTQKASAA